MTLSAISWQAWGGGFVALVLLAALVVAGIAIARRIRRREKTLNQWLAEIPQGAFKMFVAAVLAILVTIAVTAAPLTEALLCMARWQWFPSMPQNVACTHLEVHEGGLWAIVAIIAGFAGFSSMDFRTKRTTFDKNQPANSLDPEDVKAGVTGEHRTTTPALATAPATRAAPDTVLASEAPTSVPPEVKEPVSPDEIT